MHRLGSAVAAVLLAAHAHAGTVATAAAALGYEESQTDTFIVWGDTQAMVNNGTVPCADGTRCDDLEKQATWACDNKATWNIKAVLGVGDLVTLPQQSEYDNFNHAKDILDACGLPYIPTVGNHEILITGPSTAGFADTAGDASLYWSEIAAETDAAAWFGGRGMFEEFISSQATVGVVGAPLYTETNNNGQSRSFYANLGSRFSVMALEWEFGARLSDRHIQGYAMCADESNSWAWGLATMAAHPDRIWIHITHAGPCEPDGTNGCGDWSDTDDGLCGEKRDWKRYRDAADNALVFLNGHNNETNCNSGGGQFAVLTRDSGTKALAAGFDFACATRAYNATSYGWQGWVQWKRGSREVCVRTIRTINASVSPATPVEPPDFDRSDNSNDAELCTSIVLPSSLL